MLLRFWTEITHDSPLPNNNTYFCSCGYKAALQAERYYNDNDGTAAITNKALIFLMADKAIFTELVTDFMK
jgi:hypothetical protein